MKYALFYYLTKVFESVSLRKEIVFYVGAPVFIATAEGEILADGLISEITSSWSGMKIKVDQYHLTLPRHRYTDDVYRQSEDGLHVIPKDLLTVPVNISKPDHQGF